MNPKLPIKSIKNIKLKKCKTEKWINCLSLCATIFGLGLLLPPDPKIRFYTDAIESSWGFL